MLMHFTETLTPPLNAVDVTMDVVRARLADLGTALRAGMCLAGGIGCELLKTMALSGFREIEVVRCRRR
jgi:hypothetical protein